MTMCLLPFLSTLFLSFVHRFIHLIDRHMFTPFQIASIAILIPLLSSCSQPIAHSTFGLANPASQFCIEQGGQLRFEVRDQGTVGLCDIQQDGHLVTWDEWDFFRTHANK